MRRALSIGLVSAVMTIGLAMPASATVHEITGMFCAGPGGGNPFPPGISEGSNADNFAQPLWATKFIKDVQVENGNVFIIFDFDHPASKLAPHPTQEFFQVDEGLFISAFVLDTSRGFTNCKALR